MGGFIVASYDTQKWFLRIYGITFAITDLTRVNRNYAVQKYLFFKNSKISTLANNKLLSLFLFKILYNLLK